MMIIQRKKFKNILNGNIRENRDWMQRAGHIKKASVLMLTFHLKKEEVSNFLFFVFLKGILS